MAELNSLLAWRIIHQGDPIGPWLRQALESQLITTEKATELQQTQIALQREAIGLARAELDLHEKALGAIAEVGLSKG
jgi:hypothetical protein